MDINAVQVIHKVRDMAVGESVVQFGLSAQVMAHLGAIVAQEAAKLLESPVMIRVQLAVIADVPVQPVEFNHYQ